jgi:hypothetical protein
VVKEDPSSECVVQSFVHNLTHGVLIVDMDVSHAVESEKAGDSVGIHVTFTISVEDLERKALEVEHHLIESWVCQVSLAFGKIY